MVRKLPEVMYKGHTYTKDERLQEFRGFEGEEYKIVPFNSEEGFNLLLEGKAVEDLREELEQDMGSLVYRLIEESKMKGRLEKVADAVVSICMIDYTGAEYLQTLIKKIGVILLNELPIEREDDGNK
jgi:hypothetical protein